MRNRHSSHPHEYVRLRCGSGGIILPGLTRAPVKSIYSHGFRRVAACTPRVGVADAARNLAQTLGLANKASASGAVLAVFPELGLCFYAIEHLLFQDALLDAVERALGDLARVSSELDSMLVRIPGEVDR
jgi:predicted amidohydrolase